MAKAIVRNDGEHYRVYHNGYRNRGQYTHVEACVIRDAINQDKPNGCGCTQCIKERQQRGS